MTTVDGHSFQARDGTVVTYNPESRTVTLPELKSSDRAIDKTKPLPTSLQSDFLPEDLLLALTNPPPTYEKLGPPSRFRALATTTAFSRKKPAGVWANSKRREKFKHLTENTPCVCGAGQDISFLYDVPKPEEETLKADEFDPSQIRKQEELDEKPKRRTIKLPDTLIPEEYHIVKNKGVQGLEYYDDSFATQPDDHDTHLVLFPSMNPTSRYEVLQLKKTLDNMLEIAGLKEEGFQLKGPTQMHNLLEIIKKEQDIYNVIFHELIRQTSIECVERGELLAEIRGRYNTLVNKIPRQVKGLHEEVLAQRALDRRLTEELMRFKNTIGALTNELSDVKEHDKEVTAQAQQAQEDLKSALSESQKNASLLAEYHELYELQRQRLEKQVNMLHEEKEVWSIAAYSLALKVTDEHSLSTAKRLHVCEKAWAKHASHYTILLSDQDTNLLTALQGHVDRWRELVAEFNTGMKHREAYMSDQLQTVRTQIQQWVTHFQRYVLTQEGHFLKAPDEGKVETLYGDMRAWQQILSDENDKFGGDMLLAGQDLLKQIRGQMSLWSECAIVVFNRHKTDPDQEHPDYEEMMTVNQQVESLLEQFSVRLTGENGTAVGIINTGNSMEHWDNKFTAALHGRKAITEQEWLRLYTAMDEWISYLNTTLDHVGSTEKAEDKAKGLSHESVDVVEAMKAGQKWLSSTTNSIDSEDGKLVEAVNSLHTEMIKWMVQMLLRLAPDREDHSAEAREAVLLGTVSIPQLVANAKSLFQRLFNFSSYVTQCCSGIIHDEVQRRISEQDENAEQGLIQLQKLQGECDTWIQTAKLLLDELSRVAEQQALEGSTADTTGKAAAKSGNDGKIAFHDQEKLGPQERPPPMGAPTMVSPGTTIAASEAASSVSKEMLQVLGGDQNTYSKTIGQLQRENTEGEAIVAPKSPQEQGPAVPDTKMAFEAIAAVEDLQDQLIQTEHRAQLAESKTMEVENDLKDANEKIRELERKITMLETEGQAPPQSASSRPTLFSNQNTTLSSKKKEGTSTSEEDKESKDAKKDKNKASGSRASSRASTKSKKK